jgi:ferric iron reductase protein FhuF
LCEIEGALDKVKRLTGYTYELIDEEQKDKRYTGLLAQDVKSVLPEAVSETEIGMGIAYGNLAGILVQAIKEMEEKHENEIMALKREIAALSRAM